MSSLEIFLPVAATLLVIYSYKDYFVDIFKNKTKPHIYTWLVGSLVLIINTISLVKYGAGLAAIPFVVGSILCVLVFLLSLKYGSKNIKNIDKICLSLALASLVFFLFIDNKFYSVVLSIFIDLFAYLPSLRKTFDDPSSETFSYYFISGLINLFVLFSVTEFNFMTTVYPTFLLFINTTFCVLIFRKYQPELCL